MKFFFIRVLVIRGFMRGASFPIRDLGRSCRTCPVSCVRIALSCFLPPLRCEHARSVPFPFLRVLDVRGYFTETQNLRIRLSSVSYAPNCSIKSTVRLSPIIF
jgi:hypothetical protein